MIHLRLNKELYSDKAVAISIAEFEKVCQLEKTEDSGYFTILFHCDDKEIPLEFSNYVLSLERVKPC